jgi:2,4-dichlorophenol 6-monooxygenase
MHVVRIGTDPAAEYCDFEAGWVGVREISDAGAVLVRPDNHVAFRAPAAAESPTEVLSDALARLLGR